MSRSAKVHVLDRGRRQRPARVAVVSSWGLFHLLRVTSGELPAWLMKATDPSVPFRVGRQLFVLDVDQIGEAEARGEIEIIDARGPRLRGSA
jgi:hypothetical protein